MGNDILKEEAAKSTQALSEALGTPDAREKQLLKTWQAVELARLQAVKSIEENGVVETHLSRGQKTLRENKSVSALTKCSATSARLLNELFPAAKSARTPTEGDETDEELDDY